MTLQPAAFVTSLAATLAATLALWLLILLPVAGVSAERLHLLIPAGPGGGLDSTARALGAALQAEGLRVPVSYENMTGGGGGRALGHFIETADRQQNTLMVNSTPLLVRSLQGLFPHGHGDVIAIAGLIAEHSIFAVRADSPLATWTELVAALQKNPHAYRIGGGSVRGSFDHIAFALAAEAAGLEPQRLRYLPYDAGGKAMLALLGGEVGVLSTGLGEALSYVASGDVRVLAIAAERRARQLPETMTLLEQGTPLVFANWRGLFAPPGTSVEAIRQYAAQVQAATESDAWAESVARYGWTPLNIYGNDFVTYLQLQELQLAGSLKALGFIK